MRICETEEDFNSIIKDSNSRAVFLFKHSIACPISSHALKNFEEFSSKEESADYWKVLVIEDRSLSRKIADDIKVIHKSPQVILFFRGKPVWTSSHWDITIENLNNALASIK